MVFSALAGIAGVAERLDVLDCVGAAVSERNDVMRLAGSDQLFTVGLLISLDALLAAPVQVGDRRATPTARVRSELAARLGRNLRVCTQIQLLRRKATSVDGFWQQGRLNERSPWSIFSPQLSNFSPNRTDNCLCVQTLRAGASGRSFWPPSTAQPIAFPSRYWSSIASVVEPVLDLLGRGLAQGGPDALVQNVLSARGFSSEDALELAPQLPGAPWAGG